MIIDVFTMVGKSINGYELSPEKLIESMNLYGIDQSVISPVQPFGYHFEPANDEIASIVANHPTRFIGFGRVDPRQGEKALMEVDRAITQLGLKGILLHPWEEGYQVNRDFVVDVAKHAAVYQVPLLVATGYPWVSHALQVADLAEKAPNTTIIMTHGGQINISGLAQSDAYLAMKKNDNLYMETSGVYRQDFIEDIIADFGAERVMFGSHSPKMHQGFELDRAISATKSSSNVRKAVLGGSIQKILAFGGECSND